MQQIALDRQHTPQYPPMLMQYLDYKQRYPDCLLFFQVGDFYEVFFEDAVTVARAINLTLTSRDKSSPNPVPMCGVPISVADSYADRLVQQGFSVAIVSQAETAGKGMITRKLERIITPAIRVLGAADSGGDGGNVASLQISSASDAAVAFTDVQSGKIYVREAFTLDDLGSELQRIAPAELVLPKLLLGKPLDRRTAWVRSLDAIIPERHVKFRHDGGDALAGAKRLIQEVPGFKSLSPSGKRAVSFLLSYVDEITVEARLVITSIEPAPFDSVVAIDSMTRMNLELVQNARDASARGTLFEYLNKTVTSGGARFLRESVIAPLTNRDTIEFRAGIVGEFLDDVYRMEEIRRLLAAFPDLERIATRIELRIATPRELGGVRDALMSLPALLQAVSGGSARSILESSDDDTLLSFGESLNGALSENPPLATNEGGIFARGHDAELDRLADISSRGKEWIAELERREKEATGIGSLKIKYNGVFGYFIEITNTHLPKVPARYVRKQTTANSERYITEELKSREDEVLGAAEKKISLERSMFDSLRDAAGAHVEALRKLGRRVSLFDMLCGFAVKAGEQALVRPVFAKDPVLNFKRGKHPQLSELLGTAFIPNDLSLDATKKSCVIITGPNMGGKSTYLRQAALIAVMAQIGSFVPAASAEIGLVDRIFARLGASDNLAEGESTFMVEMREASAILRSATGRSLVVIDEIGRGTATGDGLALAQSILEWLVTETGARTLFATHFHELTALEQVFPDRIRNVSVGSAESEGGVIFTHAIHDGPADRSYGIEVARLAGLPESVIDRAETLLRTVIPSRAPSQGALPFADSPRPKLPNDYPTLKAVERRINSVDPNEMTPMDALRVLYELKQSLAGKGSV